MCMATFTSSSCSLSCSSTNVSSHGCSPSVFPYNKFLHKKFSNFKLVTENLLSTYARDHLRRSHLKYYCCMFSFFSHFCSYLQYSSTAHGGRHCLLSLHNTPRIYSNDLLLLNLFWILLLSFEISHSTI